jgi:hypothetical protein
MERDLKLLKLGLEVFVNDASGAYLGNVNVLG